MPDVYKNKKRICTGATNDTNSAWGGTETLGKVKYCYIKDEIGNLLQSLQWH